MSSEVVKENQDLEEALLVSEPAGEEKSDLEHGTFASSSRAGFADTLGQVNKRVDGFTRTMQGTQLNPSQKSWGFVFWVIGFLMIFVVPLLRLIYLKPADNAPIHWLVFQPFTVVIGILISSISFVYLVLANWKYDLKGMDYIENCSEDILLKSKSYQSLHQGEAVKLLKIYFPLLLLYIGQRLWFFCAVPLAYLPYLDNKIANVMIIFLGEGISWIFQTLIFLYACILFWKVCCVQESKMFVFKELVISFRMAPPLYYEVYTKIVQSLHETSRQFRLFLALSGFVTIVSALVSLYQIVVHRHGMELLMSGELLMINLVNIMGMGLCLKSASKVAHMHRRIVKAASTMHARVTFETPKFYLDEDADFQTKLKGFCQQQDNWDERNVLVTFLQNNLVGISVYGFVLDRFLVHSSIAILLMTTWFILGRSLGN